MKAASRDHVSPSDSSHEGPSAPLRQCGAIRPTKSPASADRETPAEMREAKVQALRQAVEEGTYHVPAERLAAKMLQDALQEMLP
jgi:flagellar biosynthesis anti-sigma factor FlgM